MTDVVLGMDGGQTSTTAVVCDRNGKLLGIGRAGPANHVWEPGGVARARKAVIQSTAAALRHAGLPRDTVFQAAFLGITGAKADGRTSEAVRGCVAARHTRIENDKVTALASVTAGRPGVVVIAGTGTIAYGENRSGRSWSASGWGWMLGDEGAGFWIARKAIAAACRAEDGRGNPTRLATSLLRAAGVENLWYLHFEIYSERRSRHDIAALAATVPQCADADDASARRILREAGRELGLSAGAVARRLGMTRGNPTVGMVGGVFQGSKMVRESFRREVRRHIPNAICVQPRFAPAIGAVLLALKLSGIRLTNRILKNLDAASQTVGAK